MPEGIPQGIDRVLRTDGSYREKQRPESAIDASTEALKSPKDSILGEPLSVQRKHESRISS